MNDGGETLLILGHGVIGQGQLCPPCEGMSRFELSSYCIKYWRFTVCLRAFFTIIYYDEVMHLLQGFGQPHDVAVSPDGADIYVGEIIPDRVTKFSRL